MKDIKYSSDRPLMRLEKGDIAEIAVTHFVKEIVNDKDLKKYGHIPNGIYKAVTLPPSVGHAKRKVFSLFRSFA